MSYKPKFCCECGERIERTDWKPWTSRRFCQLCATEHGAGEKLQTGLLVAFFLFGVVGLSGFWQKGENRSNAASNLTAADVSNKTKVEINRVSSSQTTAESSSLQPLAQVQTANSAIETQAKTLDRTSKNLKTEQTRLEQSPAQTEAVFFCGAQTKKGTACSRRVKGGGRCWQHAGQAALLPPEKLKIGNN